MSDDTDKKKENTSETKTPSNPLPPMADVKASLKSSIKSAVQATNDILAEMEEASDKITRPAMETYRQVEQKGEVVMKEAGSLYERRKQYGPHLVLGSSLMVGGIVGLRRGRLPGFATAAATGLMTYLGVYEVEIHRLPDVVFGKEEK